MVEVDQVIEQPTLYIPEVSRVVVVFRIRRQRA